MSNTKKLCNLALGIAVYVVLAASVKVPLVGHIQTDLGYIAFGAYLVIFGWPAAIIGVLGCIIESAVYSGWFAIGWPLGQLFIGITCGLWYKYTDNKPTTFKNITRIIVTIVSVFIGVAVIKTVVEATIYSIPYSIKFAKNMIAFVADVIPMIIGMFIGERLKKSFNFDLSIEIESGIKERINNKGGGLSSPFIFLLNRDHILQDYEQFYLVYYLNQS